MPKKSKQLDPPLNQLSAMTVDQFCAAHSISRSKFYEFIQLGKGPQCFFVGIQRRISAESATQWRKQMEMEARPSHSAARATAETAADLASSTIKDMKGLLHNG